MKTTAAILLLLLATPLAAGQAYRWKDADGTVHYSQEPPPDRDAQVLQTGKGAPAAKAAAPGAASASAASDTKKFLERVEADNKKAAEEAAKQKEAKAKAEKACSSARQRLRYLDDRTARRLATENDDGSYTRMDDAEFDKRRAAAQADIDGNCR